ncbi:hypothetical protein M0R19_05200 [Candidatus Pacearchaeota archaeon]|jgi:uncharacterized OB-fold protein|nr:hypothetical protein [Candidatus Pacearchaeota archaeon]
MISVKGGRTDKKGKRPSPNWDTLDSFKDQSMCKHCGRVYSYPEHRSCGFCYSIKTKKEK